LAQGKSCHKWNKKSISRLVSRPSIYLTSMKFIKNCLIKLFSMHWPLMNNDLYLVIKIKRKNRK